MLFHIVVACIYNEKQRDIHRMATAFNTSLCELMKIRYPIVQAGMAGSTTPELVAAVSNAGGLGILGASRLTLSQLQDSILTIKRC